MPHRRMTANNLTCRSHHSPVSVRNRRNPVTAIRPGEGRLSTHLVAVHAAEVSIALPRCDLIGAVLDPYIIGRDPHTAASAIRGSAPCFTRAFEQLVWPGGR